MMGGTTISAIIEGDGLRVVRVREGLMGGRGESIGVIESALGPGGAERARAVLGRAGGGRLVLTVPSEWAAVRAISMRCAQWREGAGEVRRSVGGLLPLGSDDAMLGLIESVGGGGGYLIGVSAAQVRPWAEMVERASGKKIDALMTRHMAMLGLGLQDHERADVLEMGDGGGWGGGVVHRLSHGLVERLGEPWGEGDALADGSVVIGAAPAGVRARVIGAEELAVGAALAGRVAGGSFVALDAEPARAWGKWMMPIGALAAAGALFVGGGVWHEARLERASQRLDARIAQIGAEVEAVSDVRDEALATMALIETARKEAAASSGKMLPALVSALESVPAGGFVYSVEISRDRLLMRGEAGRAGDVVRGIENSASFEGAKLVSPVTTSRVSGGEVFDVAADRTKAGGGR